MISVYLLLDLCPSPAQTPARPRLPSVSHTPPSPSVSLAPPSPATETGVSVPRACGAVRRRNGTEVFPGRAARHHWATEWGRNVAQACGAFLVCKLLKKDASLHGSRNALWNVSNRLGWSRRKGMLIYPVLDVVLVSVGGVAGDHLTDESG